MSDNLNDIIRNSFYKSNASEAPNLWSKIDAELDQSSLDRTIKDSFESQNQVAPDAVWNKIEDQLDIDKTWSNLSKNIRVRRAVTIAQIAAVILVLILPVQLSNVGYQLNTMGFQKNLSSISESDLIKEPSIDHSAENSGLTEQYYYSSNVANNLTETTPTIIETAPIAEISEQDNHNLVKEDQEINLSLNRLNAKSYAFEDRIAELNTDGIESFGKAKKVLGFSFGIMGGIDNTWILDDETRAGFDSESLVRNGFSFGNSYGVFAEYQVTNHISVSAQYAVNSLYNQHIDAYANGKFVHKHREINASRASLLAGWNSRSFSGAIPHASFVRVGGYLNWIKNDLAVTDGTITEMNSFEKNRNFGLQLELGQRMYFNSFWIEGGFKSNASLSSMKSKQFAFGSDDEKTKLVSLGLYLKAAYSF